MELSSQINIKGVTLFIRVDGGNIGHAFNDHAYASMAYYLEYEDKIDNIYIQTDKYTDILVDNLKKRKLMEGNKRIHLNSNMIILYFYKTTKNIIFNNESSIEQNKYTFEHIVRPDSDRFFKKYVNYLQVFSRLLENFKLYKYDNNILDVRYDVSILYRSSDKNGRNIYNLNLFETILKSNNIKYRLMELDTKDYYTFFDIANIFHTSDNIICINGCELTYGIFMEPNTHIIELSSIHKIESWWNTMQGYFIAYGLNYDRLTIEMTDGNLYMNDSICSTLLDKINIKNYDNFVSLGERCDNAIALFNNSYKKGSCPFDYIISNLKGINDVLFNQKSFNKIVDDSIGNNNNNAFRFPHHNIEKEEDINMYKQRLKNIFNKKLNYIYSCINNNNRILFMYTYKGNFKEMDELNTLSDNLINQLNYNNFKILIITQNKMVHTDNKFIDIQYTIDRKKKEGFNGTDYGDMKLRHFIQNYLLTHFYTSKEKIIENKNNTILSVTPVGSRCINAAILSKSNYRQFSNIFDYIDIRNFKNTFISLVSGFDTLLNHKNLVKSYHGEETKTKNIIFDDGNELTFPHANLFDASIYKSFIVKKERFNKLKFFNNLFVFTDTRNGSLNDIIFWAKNVKIFFDRNLYKYTLLIILLTYNDDITERYTSLYSYDNIAIYRLFYHSNSYTGGLFHNEEDNKTYIKIIDIFKNNNMFICKDEIDNLVV